MDLDWLRGQVQRSLCGDWERAPYVVVVSFLHTPHSCLPEITRQESDICSLCVCVHLINACLVPALAGIETGVGSKESREASSHLTERCPLETLGERKALLKEAACRRSSAVDRRGQTVLQYPTTAVLQGSNNRAKGSFATMLPPFCLCSRLTLEDHGKGLLPLLKSFTGT